MSGAGIATPYLTIKKAEEKINVILLCGYG